MIDIPKDRYPHSRRAWRCPMKLSTASLLYLFLAFSSLAAQTKALTNDDIVQLVKAGLDEQTVVKAIRTSATNFDTSAQALVALKTAGVTRPILDAMLEAGTPRPPAAANAAGSGAPDGLPEELGIYFKGSQ